MCARVWYYLRESLTCPVHNGIQVNDVDLGFQTEGEIESSKANAKTKSNPIRFHMLIGALLQRRGLTFDYLSGNVEFIISHMRNEAWASFRESTVVCGHDFPAPTFIIMTLIQWLGSVWRATLAYPFVLFAWKMFRISYSYIIYFLNRAQLSGPSHATY